MCCKDKKLSLFLVLNPEQRIDENYQKKIHPILKSLLEWSDLQVEFAIDSATERKDCLVYEDTQDNVMKMSKNFAINGISHYVLDPSLRK